MNIYVRNTDWDDTFCLFLFFPYICELSKYISLWGFEKWKKITLKRNKQEATIHTHEGQAGLYTPFLAILSRSAECTRKTWSNGLSLEKLQNGSHHQFIRFVEFIIVQGTKHLGQRIRNELVHCTKKYLLIYQSTSVKVLIILITSNLASFSNEILLAKGTTLDWTVSNEHPCHFPVSLKNPWRGFTFIKSKRKKL